jgi:hypothetical protein
MPSAQRAWLSDRQRVCRRKALGFPGARRIARELGKLYDAGVITGADDSNLVFYACLIRDCGATVLPAPASDPPRDTGDGGPDGIPPPGVFVPENLIHQRSSNVFAPPLALLTRSARDSSRRP